MSKDKLFIKKHLIHMHLKQNIVFFGRATSALYAILKAIRTSGGTILLPSIICPSVPIGAYIAGWNVVFCDIDIKTLNISLKSLKKIIGINKNIDVICIPHIYHGCSDIEKISKYVKKTGIHLIEDCAQSFGSVISNQTVGTFGDSTILSFGYSKQLNVGGGGGALLTNDVNLKKETSKVLGKIPDPPKQLHSLFTSYRQLYYNNGGLKIFREKGFFNIHKFIKIYRNMYIFNHKNINFGMIRSKIKNFESLRSTYQKNYNYIYKNLSKVDTNMLFIPHKLPNVIPWRFSFLIKKNRDLIVDKLRKYELHVSTWYPAITTFPINENYDKKQFKNSFELEKSIINLWTNQEVDKKYYNDCISIIQNNIL